MMMTHDELDDFDDIDLDDIEDLDDGWDDLDDNDLDIAAPSSGPKKKSSFSSIFTFLVIFIALGIGLFILYTTFKPSIQGMIGTDTAQNEVAQTESPPQQITDEMIDPLFVQGDGLPPMPTPLSGDQPMADNPDLTPLPEFADIDLEPLPNLQAQSNIEPVDTIAPVAASQPSTQIVYDSKNSSADVTALEKEIALKLQNNDARLTSLDDKMVRLEAMMARIEERLSTVQNTPVVTHVQPQPVATETENWVPVTETKEKDWPPVTSAEPTYTPKATAAPRKIVKKKVVKKKATTWQLRSAQPGKATVAPKGSNDIRSVTVGSTLSGIGRIKSISNATGKWVVTGTTGKISQ